MLELRKLGNSDLTVSPIAMGLWPISGMTTLGVDDDASILAIQTAIECGINHFDTAYSYGIDGRSDRILRTAVAGNYSNLVIASKVGMYYCDDGTRHLDSSPTMIELHCHEVIERLGIEQIDLLYLHCFDGRTPIESSAIAMAQLVEKRFVRYVGICNITPDQFEHFASVINPIALQLPLNLLQVETYKSFKRVLKQFNVSYIAYWALMKGLLSGSMTREHVFDSRDKRLTYDIYQGQAWQEAHDLIDQLRLIAKAIDCSVAQLVVAWTVAQPHIGSVLCGAKNAAQIRETASVLNSPLDHEVLTQIEEALAEHWAASTTGSRTEQA